MKIKVKSSLFKGPVEVQVEPTDTVRSLKNDLSSKVKVSSELFKVIFQEKLVNDNIKISDLAIKEGDAIVVLVKRIQVPTPVDPTPVPTKAVIAQRTSVSKGRGLKDKGGKMGKADSPSNEPASPSMGSTGQLPQPNDSPSVAAPQTVDESMNQLRNQLQDLMSNIIGLTNNLSGASDAEDNESGNESQSEGEEATESPSTVPQVPVDPVALQSLVDMGFSEARAKKALILSRNHKNLAMEWLLQHTNDVDIDEPINPNQMAQVNRAATQFIPNPNAVSQLKDMGFKEEDIIEALRATNNNQEAACAYLLGDREDSDEGISLDDTSFLDILQSNPIVQQGLSNPRVLQALRELMQNPASAPMYMNDPEIGPVLLQVSRILSNNF